MKVAQFSCFGRPRQSLNASRLAYRGDMIGAILGWGKDSHPGDRRDRRLPRQHQAADRLDRDEVAPAPIQSTIRPDGGMHHFPQDMAQGDARRRENYGG